MPIANIGFLLLGLFVGAFGTLIGAGGGFILVPTLLFLFPEMRSVEITSISMFCVAVNALSGSAVYYFKKQIHYKSAFFFTLASLPGAWVGAHLTQFVSRQRFEFMFAFLLVGIGSFLILKNYEHIEKRRHDQAFHLTHKDYFVGVGVSFGVGFVASFLGIGGGIIHVPLMVQFLNFPVHLAAGTSHLILALAAIVATIEHLLSGELNLHQPFLYFIAAGVILGAQIGGRLSKRVRAQTIMRFLGGALILVALRLFFSR